MFGSIIMVIFSFLVFDWHSRRVFIAIVYRRRYGHGKSWNRAYKHYKKNWSLLQRLFWIFAFKEKYERPYRMFAYLFYVHILLSIISIVALLTSKTFPDMGFWEYVVILDLIFGLFRYIHSDSIARG